MKWRAANVAVGRVLDFGGDHVHFSRQNISDQKSGCGGKAECGEGDTDGWIDDLLTGALFFVGMNRKLDVGLFFFLAEGWWVVGFSEGCSVPATGPLLPTDFGVGCLCRLAGIRSTISRQTACRTTLVRLTVHLRVSLADNFSRRRGLDISRCSNSSLFPDPLHSRLTLQFFPSSSLHLQLSIPCFVFINRCFAEYISCFKMDGLERGSEMSDGTIHWKCW